MTVLWVMQARSFKIVKKFLLGLSVSLRFSLIMLSETLLESLWILSIFPHRYWMTLLPFTVRIMYFEHHFGEILSLESGVQLIYKTISFGSLWMQRLGSYVWPFSICFNSLISAWLEKLNSNWYGISFPCKGACSQHYVVCRWQIQQGSLCYITNEENSWCKCLIVSLTVNTWTANFVHEIIKFLFQQQVFLQSVVSIQLDKHGIYAQQRKKTRFSTIVWLCYRFYTP